MGKVFKNIKDNWLLYFIILQPIIDVIAYFQIKIIKNSFSWVIRIIMLLIMSLFVFINSKNKKKLILLISPFIIFFILHIANLYRINSLNLILDTKYYVLVFQMPILTIMLLDYIKSNDKSISLIKKGMFISLIIIFIVVALSYITNTYETTYGYNNSGIIGWFTGSNTPSMILCALCPWAVYYGFSKNNYVYIFSCIIAFILLYFNATKACYITLVTTSVLTLFNAMVEKNVSTNTRIIKMVISIIFVFSTVFLYKYSFTYININKSNQNIKASKNEIDKITTPTGPTTTTKPNNNRPKTTKPSVINPNEPIDQTEHQKIVEILKTSYIYAELMEKQGEEKVVKYMRNNLTPDKLADNRFLKIINAKIETEDSDFISKVLGVGYSRFAAKSYDLETDLDAIFYYYGYLGFGIYMVFILYFLIIAFIKFVKKPTIIRNAEFVTLCYLIPLLVGGGQYSGAFLRKPNANIYLSLFLVLMYVLCKKTSNLKKKTANSKKKVTFLCLHLGYGGIETATINSANTLCRNYDVDIVSFYNLKQNQASLLDKKVKVKYLCKHEPNKDVFLDYIHKHQFLKAFKEGIIAVIILLQKKLLIINEIENNQSDAIVSTRYDFSTLLSRYGKEETIKIAQEHHHHNNDKKYINILKTKYYNIDYLCALTKSLKKDYEVFLKNNHHTKIVLLPNILINNVTSQSDLKHKNIISVSRLDKGKKIDDLITIFSKLKNQDSKLYIIGNGTEMNTLKNLTKNLGITERVTFTGYLSHREQEKYYLDSSIFAMTSISEGLPMVLLEAMSYGLPCIAYKTDSGIEDIISNNENGYIIKSRNEKEYVEKLDAILNNSKEVKKLGANALKTTKNFEPDEILKIWNKILNDCEIGL